MKRRQVFGPRRFFVFGVRVPHGVRVLRDDGGHRRVGQRSGQASPVPVRHHRRTRTRCAHHLATGLAEVRGTVYAPPHTRSAPIEGTITIRLLGEPRSSATRSSFAGDDGHTYELRRSEGHLIPSSIRDVHDAPGGHRRRDDPQEGRQLPRVLRPSTALVVVFAQLSTCLIRQVRRRDFVNTW